jgi:hypothetical protein
MTVSATGSSRLTLAPSGVLLALVSPLPLFWFGLAGKSRRGRWLLLFAFVLVLAGCGTSFKGSQQQQAQPSTYNVTVTASGASAPTHAQTFVLTMTQ